MGGRQGGLGTVLMSESVVMLKEGIAEARVSNFRGDGLTCRSG